MDGLYDAKSDQIGICMYQSDLITLALYTAAAVDEDRRTGHTSASEVSKEAKCIIHSGATVFGSEGLKANRSVHAASLIGNIVWGRVV